MIGAENQQERLTCSKDNINVLRELPREKLKYFLAGFVDGEGSFNISFAKPLPTRPQWTILTKFQIYQHQNHREILELFQEVLDVGHIDKKSGSDVLSLTVESRRNLIGKVIPFFRAYPLATKAEAFRKFDIIINMMNRKEHKMWKGFEKIVLLAHSMNAEGRFRLYSAEYILETARATLFTINSLT
jgi:LAGLIDADG endonuclease